MWMHDAGVVVASFRYILNNFIHLDRYISQCKRTNIKQNKKDIAEQRISTK